MTDTDPSNDTSKATIRRRTLLSAGAKGAAVGLGVGYLPGRAAAWKRFDIDFKSADEVWMIVGDDLHYEPPVVAHVLVSTGGAVTCRLVEFTEANATTVPDQYGSYPVVKYSADAGDVLGVVAYSRPPGGENRFSRPRCVMPNDQLGPDVLESSDVVEASCVNTAIEDHWNGELRTCWWDSLDPVDEPTAVETTITPDAPTDWEEFGAALATSDDGSTVVVGAPGFGTSGAVYIFERENEWHQQAKITPADDAGVSVGRAVDVNAEGTLVIVGAPPDERRHAGMALVYSPEGDTWELVDRLRAEPDTPAEGFGWAVALDGDGSTALVGAPILHSLPGENLPGRGYVFEGSEWTQTAMLSIPGDYEFATENYSQHRSWGRTVALSDSGSTALLGNPFVGLGFGEVHAFTADADQWSHATMLRSGVEDQHLGYALDLTADGDVAVIGSNVDGEVTPHEEGFVDILEETTSPWSAFEVDVLAPDDGEPMDRFGRAISIEDEGETILVGSPYKDTASGSNAGAVYLYGRDAGTFDRRRTLVAADGSEEHRFGETVAVDGDGKLAFVGAPLATVDHQLSGKLYVFYIAEDTNLNAARSSNASRRSLFQGRYKWFLERLRFE